MRKWGESNTEPRWITNYSGTKVYLIALLMEAYTTHAPNLASVSVYDQHRIAITSL